MSKIVRSFKSFEFLVDFLHLKWIIDPHISHGDSKSFRLPIEMRIKFHHLRWSRIRKLRIGSQSRIFILVKIRASFRLVIDWLSGSRALVTTIANCWICHHFPWRWLIFIDFFGTVGCLFSDYDHFVRRIVSLNDSFVDLYCFTQGLIGFFLIVLVNVSPAIRALRIVRLDHLIRYNIAGNLTTTGNFSIIGRIR